MAFQKERFADCHMAVGNNIGLSLKLHHVVAVGLVFTEELLILACCVNVNILNIPIKNCLLCRFLTFQKADVERRTYVVHLLCVKFLALCSCRATTTTTVTVIINEVILRVHPGTAVILKFTT